MEKGAAEGYKMEAEKFGQLAMSKECKALMGLFFGQTESKKNPFGKPPSDVKYYLIFHISLLNSIKLVELKAFIFQNNRERDFLLRL